jgi:hypothetical protein
VAKFVVDGVPHGRKAEVLDNRVVAMARFVVRIRWRPSTTQPVLALTVGGVNEQLRLLECAVARVGRVVAKTVPPELRSSSLAAKGSRWGSCSHLRLRPSIQLKPRAD